MKLRRVLACVLAVAIAWGPFSATEAAEPGGQGILAGNLNTRCFATNRPGVPEVCADYTIRWRLWTLMGEPVGNYTLHWQLLSLTLANPQNGAKQTYTALTLPSEIQTAAQKLQLSIDAVALDAANGVRHHFDTGAPIRAGTDSVNVPGSPRWDELFTIGCDGQKLAGSPVGATEQAKAVMQHGVALSSFQLCGNSGFSNLDAVEAAMAKACAAKGTGNRPSFCSKSAKTPESPKDDASAKVIDAAFARMEGRSTEPSLKKSPAAAKPAKGTGGDIDRAFAKMEKDEQARQVTRLRQSHEPQKSAGTENPKKTGQPEWSSLLERGRDFNANTNNETYAYCQETTINGRAGWRMPKLAELEKHLRESLTPTGRDKWIDVVSSDKRTMGNSSCTVKPDGSVYACYGIESTPNFIVCVHD